MYSINNAGDKDVWKLCKSLKIIIDQGRSNVKMLIFNSLVMCTEKHSILYAEDDPDDLFIVQQAFETYEAEVELIHAIDGFQTLKCLDELHAENKLPCLIILDINMPGMNGREALVEIRQSDIFKAIPVVLFTTSSSQSDKLFAKEWGAEFITKPIIYDELKDLAKNFVNMCSHEVTRRA